MTAAWFTYTRFELLRTFRNRRFFIFSLVFPLVLYFLIAGPNRHDNDFANSGVSAPLYYMVGLASFGTMTAMLSSGARIATEREVGLEPAAAAHTAAPARVSAREGAHGLPDGLRHDCPALHLGRVARRAASPRTSGCR